MIEVNKWLTGLSYQGPVLCNLSEFKNVPYISEFYHTLYWLISLLLFWREGVVFCPNNFILCAATYWTMPLVGIYYNHKNFVVWLTVCLEILIISPGQMQHSLQDQLTLLYWTDSRQISSKCALSADVKNVAWSSLPAYSLSLSTTNSRI